jgi:hypothetical protein
VYILAGQAAFEHLFTDVIFLPTSSTPKSGYLLSW